MNRKILLLLAVAAAYGIYKFSQLSEEEKDKLIAKAKDFLDKGLGSLTDLFASKETEAG